MEIGKNAVTFCLSDVNNEQFCLNEITNKWIVLYFYPKDNTSGCTKEAIDFTERVADFNSQDAVIIGISPDKPETHLKFIKKHNLGITLLSDPEKNVMKQYGAWGMKKNYGKVYEGVIRSTFLISPAKKIIYRWKNVSVRRKTKDKIIKHVDAVFNKLIETKNT